MFFSLKMFSEEEQKKKCEALYESATFDKILLNIKMYFSKIGKDFFPIFQS